MRKRTKEVKIRLTEEEFNDLNEKAKRAHMNRERYLRKVLGGAVIYEWPHDVHQLWIETKKLGTHIEYLKFNLWNRNIVNRQTLEDACKRVWDASELITQEFIYPHEKFKQKGKLYD